MKYVVAVSGGVDSVALLDILAHENKHELIVAHFDHGIRENSAADAQFVAELAHKYSLPFESKREVLGKNASEELARNRRYLFLRDVAKKHKAVIVTAHHMNDIAETVAINIARGTGWRGIAVLASDIYRPLLGMMKDEIIAYAKDKNLEWREDCTNASSAYLRNRLRLKLSDKDVVLQLSALRARQVELRDLIDKEVLAVLSGADREFSRYFFTQVPTTVAIELLQGIAAARLGHSLPRPQLERSLLAIKAARPGAVFPFGEARLVVDKKLFSLSAKTPLKMI